MKRLAGIFGSHNEVASDAERTVERQLVVFGDPGTGKTHLIEALITRFPVSEWWGRPFDWPVDPVEVDLDSEAFTAHTLPAGGDSDSEQIPPDARISDSQTRRHILHLKCREAWSYEDYQIIRTLLYPDTDVVAVCVAVNDPASLRNAVDKWYPEILYYMPTVQILLVGTKADLRKGLDEDESGFITQERIRDVVQRMRAVGYVECSGRTFEGVQEVTNVLARISFQSRHKMKRDGCVVA